MHVYRDTQLLLFIVSKIYCCNYRFWLIKVAAVAFHLFSVNFNFFFEQTDKENFKLSLTYTFIELQVKKCLIKGSSSHIVSEADPLTVAKVCQGYASCR